MLMHDVQFEQTRNLVIARLGMPNLSGPEMAELAAEMSEAVRYDNAQLFVLDMAKVEFMDSASIGGLVTFLQDLEHVHGRVGIAACQPNVEFLFKVTRLDNVVTLFADVEEALEEWL